MILQHSCVRCIISKPAVVTDHENENGKPVCEYRSKHVGPSSGGSRTIIQSGVPTLSAPYIVVPPLCTCYA